MATSPAMLIDGQPGERVAAGERALQYGDGLFETITCCDGQPRWLERHLQRLREGCRRLQLRFELNVKGKIVFYAQIRQRRGTL